MSEGNPYITPEQEEALRGRLQEEGHMVTGEEPVIVASSSNVVRDIEHFYQVNHSADGVEVDEDAAEITRPSLDDEQYEESSSIIDTLVSMNRKESLPVVVTTDDGAEAFVAKPF